MIPTGLFESIRKIAERSRKRFAAGGIVTDLRHKVRRNPAARLSRQELQYLIKVFAPVPGRDEFVDEIPRSLVGNDKTARVIGIGDADGLIVEGGGAAADPASM